MNTVNLGSEEYSGQGDVATELRRAVVQNPGHERRVWSNIRLAGTAIASVINPRYVPEGPFQKPINTRA